MAGQLGVGGERKLADAALVGSAEDARVVQGYRAGLDQPGRDIPGLLIQIADAIRQQTAVVKNAAPPAPVIVTLP